MKIAKIIIFAVIAVALIWFGIWYNRKMDNRSREQAAGEQAATAQAQADLLSKLQVKDIVLGMGAEAKNGDTVTVNYTGMLSDGTVFDSNTDPKFKHVQPFSFALGQGQVIQGWDLGVLGMKVGGKRDLVIPPELGYGSNGQGPIPANSTLYFTVELLSVGSSTSGQ